MFVQLKGALKVWSSLHLGLHPNWCCARALGGCCQQNFVHGEVALKIVQTYRKHILASATPSSLVFTVSQSN